MNRPELGLIAIDAIEAASPRALMAGVMAWIITLAPMLAGCVWFTMNA
jgi:hypothetical protein